MLCSLTHVVIIVGSCLFVWFSTSSLLVAPTVLMDGMCSPRVQTPRPAPLFIDPPLVFSTKKERGRTLIDHVPPKPPIKSAPPVSRIFPRKELMKAHPVSFKSPDKALLSPHYNESNKELFFDQCFTIVSKLGVGSFGEVFKVRSKEDGCLYAIKRSRQRFRGESDRLRKLEEVAKHESLPAHNNCVQFIKAWEEKQHLYIQTELCKTSLSQFAEDNHNIPERLICKYLVDLLRAVRHLHDHDLVHMDIKPDNIFISSSDVCKLGDFGLVLDLTKDIEVVDAQEGDPKYLAPELMCGQFGKPADIFSLGITILELASDLDLPRGGDLWHQLRSGQLPEEFMLGVSSELRFIIRWMMEPDPAKRPTVHDIIRHEFISKILRERVEQEELSDLQTLPSNLEPHPTTPCRSMVDAFKHPTDWDHSFSDDDLIEHGADFSINNSVGIPLLDTSSSGSENSFRQRSASTDGFALACVHRRKAMSSPSRIFHSLTAGSAYCHPCSTSESTVLNSFCCFYSSSPLSGSALANESRMPHSASPLQVFTQRPSIDTSDAPECIMLAPDIPGHQVEPKNLMKAFDHTSDDEMHLDFISENL